MSHSRPPPSSPALGNVLLNRFQILTAARLADSELLPCFDLSAGRKAVLIKLSATPARRRHEDSEGPEVQVLGDEVTLVFPKLTVDVDGLFFAVSYPATLTNLGQNLSLLNQIQQPASEAEAIRIGHALCVGLAAAAKSGVKVILDPDFIYFETSGTLQILAFYPGQIPVAKADSASSLSADTDGIAILMTRLLKPLAARDQVTIRGLDGISNLHLRSVLARGLEGKINTVNEFAEVLSSIGAAKIMRPRMLANTMVALALVMVLIVGYFSHGNKIKDGQNQARQSAVDVREAAIATVTQWRAFALDYADTIPPQVVEADQLFAKAEESWTASEFSEAKRQYQQANALYAAGLKVAKVMEDRRNLANGARLQAMTLGSGWLRLASSPYVDVPEEVKQAQQAVATGDFRFLDHNYADAQMAYDLAAERFQSIPATQLKSLTQKHDAHANADRAKYAEQAWKQIAPSADSQIPDAARQASSSMAQGQALLLAGEDAQAAAAFQQTHDLYNAATAALIKNMVSKQEITDARDRAADAAQRWRNLSKILDTPEPADITQADLLLQMAGGSFTAGKPDQAKTQLNSATAIYEREIADLQDRAGGQYEADAARAKILLASIQSQKSNLETNLAIARKNIESINLQLLAERASQEHGELLKQLADAQAEFNIESRLSALCEVVVFAGTKFEQARDSLQQAQAMQLQDNKVAAAAASGPAVADLEALAKLPAQTREYLAARIGVEAKVAAIMSKLGTIARQQSSVQTNLFDAGQLLAQAEEQIKLGNAQKAQQMVNDASLYYTSLPSQVAAALLEYAIRADGELRNDTAIATLKELLEFDPDNEPAKRLLSQVQSKDLPKERFAIADGSWRLNGNPIPNQPSMEDLERILGKKARTLSSQPGFVFDDAGIMAITSPENGRVTLITAYYSTPTYEYEPHNAYQGLVEVEGVFIKPDSSMDDLAHSLARWQPQISGNIIALKLNNFHLQIAYGKSTNAIYTVSMGLNELN